MCNFANLNYLTYQARTVNHLDITQIDQQIHHFPGQTSEGQPEQLLR